MSTSGKDSMIGKRIPKSGHITTPEDRRNKLNPQKNLVSTTEQTAVDLGNSGAAVKPTVTGSSPFQVKSLFPVNVSSLPSVAVANQILAESSSRGVSSPPCVAVVANQILAESSSPVTGSAPSGGAVPQAVHSLSGGIIGGRAWNLGPDTPRRRGDRHNFIWWCRFIFDGILLTCLERYSDHFADSGEKILGVFMCYLATTLVWLKMTAGVHRGFSATMEWTSIILKMTAIICIKILELMGCNDDLLFVVKCLLAIGINWFTHMALHQRSI